MIEHKRMRLGASDFVNKPWDNQHLLQVIHTVMSLSKMIPAQNPKREELDRKYDFRSIVSQHPKMVKIMEIVGRVSGTDASILITGESGTGKEVIAEAIHRNSGRKEKKPFVKVNLGGISSFPFFLESQSGGPTRFIIQFPPNH